MSFKKCKDLILGIVMLLFSGFYLINATQIKTRPKLTPGYASAIASCANVAPRLAVDIYEKFQAKDYQGALDAQFRLSALLKYYQKLTGETLHH